MARRTSPPAILLIVLAAAACADRSPIAAPPQGASSVEASTQCALGVDAAQATALLSALASKLDVLVNDRFLSATRAASLRLHLVHATTAIAEGRTCEAAAQIQAFRQRVETMGELERLPDAALATLLGPVRRLEVVEPLPGDPLELYAPGVIGEWRTIQVGGRDFTYEVIDGLAIFQGDIVLGVADVFEASIASGAGAADADVGMTGVCKFNFSCEAWTNGVIGYSFANDWGTEANNAEMRRRITLAIAHWEARTSIRFVRRTDGERVVFRNSMGCSSNFGRNIFTGFDPQAINLSMGCGYGQVLHEIGHAVGLFHEQGRDDRGDFVRILEENIQDGREGQFSQYGDRGTDIGAYDYGSLMHYECDAFRADGATGNTLEPAEGSEATCADVAQRDSLSTRDILGFYTLYPPDMDITGAVPGETADRFTLELTFTTEPVADAYIQWFSNRLPNPLATGPVFSTGDVPLPDGEHLLSARVVIGGTRVATRSVRVTIATSAPVVDLGPDRTVSLNRLFYATASVTDAEDGACPVSVCAYTWDPAPESDAGGTAGYRYTEPGPRTISATVRDGSGRTGTDELTVSVVNDPPVVTILSPVAAATYNAGAAVYLVGTATDLNEGPDPGPGNVSCSAIAWTSSDPSDVIAFPCGPVITFGDPGPRMLRMTATDPQGLSTSAQVSVQVAECGDNCAPVADIIFRTRSELDGSRYFPTFTGPGYFLTTPLRFDALLSDADVPADSPLEFEWRLRVPCFGGDCPDLVLGSGTRAVGSFPEQITLNWTPADDVVQWSNCVSTALPYRLRLWVRDSRGATTLVEREFHLACSLI